MGTIIADLGDVVHGISDLHEVAAIVLGVCPGLEPKLGRGGKRLLNLFELREKSGKNDFLRVLFL